MANIALVGGAHIHTPGFANTIRDTQGITCKYVWDPDAATARRRQQVTGGQVVEDVRTIWEDEQVQAVVICSQTVRHHELALAAASAGKHLFVEKPLAMNGEEAQEIATAVEQAGVIFQSGYFMRSSPEIRFARQALRSGKLGKLTRMRMSNCHHGSLAGWFDGEWRWMADPQQAGCGAFGDMGAHVLDLILWFTQGDPVTRCTGQVSVVTGRYGDCDESGEGMIVLESQAIATLAAGWVDHNNPNTLEISGTQGHIRILNDRMLITCPQITGREGERGWRDFDPPLPHAFDMFLAAIQGEADLPLVSVREAAMNTTVMTAIYKGAENLTWETPAI